jgi:hypothetical protein
MNFAIPGNAATIRYGDAMPMPRDAKMTRISPVPCESAKPTAVPTSGAEHGVASRVATKPARKCDVVDVPPAIPPTRVNNAGGTAR